MHAPLATGRRFARGLTHAEDRPGATGGSRRSPKAKPQPGTSFPVTATAVPDVRAIAAACLLAVATALHPTFRHERAREAIAHRGRSGRPPDRVPTVYGIASFLTAVGLTGGLWLLLLQVREAPAVPSARELITGSTWTAATVFALNMFGRLAYRHLAVKKETGAARPSVRGPRNAGRVVDKSDHDLQGAVRAAIT